MSSQDINMDRVSAPGFSAVKRGTAEAQRTQREDVRLGESETAMGSSQKDDYGPASTTENLFKKE